MLQLILRCLLLYACFTLISLQKYSWKIVWNTIVVCKTKAGLKQLWFVSIGYCTPAGLLASSNTWGNLIKFKRPKHIMYTIVETVKTTFMTSGRCASFLYKSLKWNTVCVCKHIYTQMFFFFSSECDHVVSTQACSNNHATHIYTMSRERLPSWQYTLVQSPHFS